MKRTPLVAFFVLAIALTWAQWIPLVLGGAVIDTGGWPTHAPGLLGPMLAALLVTGATEGRAGLAPLLRRMAQWRTPSFGAALAVLSPFALLAVALLVNAILGRPAPAFADFGRMGGFPDAHPLVAFLLITVVNGFGEETGWRGYALPRLQERFSPLLAPAILFLPIALWHAPAFWILESYRQIGLAMIPGFLIGLLCGSYVLAWLWNRTGGSVLMLAIWHGGFNLVTATVAARGLIAAIASTAVMVWAFVLVGLELRARRHGGSILLPREAAPA